MTHDVIAHFEEVKQAIAEAGAPYHLDLRPKAEIVAVSKTQPEEAIRPLLEHGHRLFGENRVQEAQGKWPALKADYSDIQLHLIGPLQSNKAEDAVALFDMIQTVDREKIAKALKKAMVKQERDTPCLIQVNTGEEPQKAGVTPKEADDFIRFCQNEVGLEIRGLMCIPPVESRVTEHFMLLKTMAEAHDLPELSMGMSADYGVAAAMGASYVRVGSAIFGARA